MYNVHEWFEIRSGCCAKGFPAYIHTTTHITSYHNVWLEDRGCIIELLSSFDFLQLLRVVVQHIPNSI